VPADRYSSYVEIAELDDFDYSGSGSRAWIHVVDMADGRSGQITAPEAGDYVLRYVIEHPTAGRHMITAQPLTVRADGVAADGATLSGGAMAPRARMGSIEPGIDRPGNDIAQTPITGDDPLACQALCAADGACRAWTFVHPGEPTGEGICWTKAEVPEATENPCCTSGVMEQAAAPATAPATAPAPSDTATLDFPGTVAAGADFTVAYTGPLLSGDWIDIITPGDDDDMSGGRGWAWATGAPVTLTAPAEPGAYVLRYVAEHPEQGRTVLMRGQLIVTDETAAPTAPAPAATAQAPATQLLTFVCPAGTPGFCQQVDPETGITFALPPGFGITQPYFYETPGGSRADRASVDLVRLADGETVAWFNLRQAAMPGCFDSGEDRVCLGVDPGQDEGMAIALILGSLGGAYAPATEPEADPGAGEDDFAGVWTLRIWQDGHPRNESPLAVVELAEPDAEGLLRGSFRSAPDFAGYEGLQGEAVVGFDPDGRMRLHLIAEGGPTLVMLADAFGPLDWTGEIGNPRPDPSPVLGVAFSRVAAPGEDWRGAPWMHGEADGMAAAMEMARRALGEALGDASPEDRAALDMIGQIAGALAGGGLAAPGAAAAAPSAQMQALGGVLMEGIDADEALILLVPHLEVTR
jgi:hypothetical protein